MVGGNKMKNIVVKNSVANIIAKIWSILSLYLFVPIWINLLGIEGYGVISFYTVLVTLMHFADAGLSATLTREFARGDIDNRYRRDLLRTIECIYIIISVLIVLAIVILSDIIVDHFLKSSVFTHDELRYCVCLMGCSVSLQFLYSLYNGGLQGLQQQVLSNIITVLYGVSRSAIVIIPLLISPTIQSFFIWQLFSIACALIVTRYFLARNIGGLKYKSKFRMQYLNGVWKFALGMMLMSIISSLNTQLDKLIIGNIISLKDMGYYSLANTIGIAVITIIQPLCTAFYPELTNKVSYNDRKVNDALFLFTYIVASIAATVGLFMFCYLEELSYLWTQDIIITNAVKIPARLLIIGNLLQSLQFPLYYLALAHGYTKTNVKLGIGMLIFMIPAVYIFTFNWGVNATAIPYVIINIIATIYLTLAIVNRFMEGQLLHYLQYVLVPVVIAFVLVYIPYAILQICHVAQGLLTCCVGVISCIISIYVMASVLIRLNRDIYIPIRIRKFLL